MDAKTISTPDREVGEAVERRLQEILGPWLENVRQRFDTLKAALKDDAEQRRELTLRLTSSQEELVRSKERLEQLALELQHRPSNAEDIADVATRGLEERLGNFLRELER